jgi:type IV fimbrial biogenesis protein FimT
MTFLKKWGKKHTHRQYQIHTVLRDRSSAQRRISSQAQCLLMTPLEETATKQHRQSGFSILELLLVCSLFGLMLTISWPALQEMLARQQAQSYMRQFQQHLNYARIIAISSGRLVTFCPQHGQDCLNQWWQIPVQITLKQSNQQLKLLRQLERPADMHWLYYNREQIQFRQDGSLQALQNGTFVYCARHYDWHLTLSLSQAGRSQTEFVSAPCPN